MTRRGLLLVVLLAGSCASAGAETSVTFTRAPTATKTPGGVRIDFAVSAATDVAVFVRDAKGAVVRHLAAGMLGKNAPAPLKADSLEQSLAWDGTGDDGKPAPGGPFSIRVGAGMTAGYAGTAFGSEPGPNNLANVIGLATGPGGRLYVLSNAWRRAWWSATAVHLFLRDGAYERTIKPFSPKIPPERVKAITALTDAQGRPVPTIYRVLAMSYYPHEDIPQQMAVTPDGNLHLVVIRAAYRKGSSKCLATIDSDGGVPYGAYAGGPLPDRTSAARVFLAAAGDGKAVYATGLERGAEKNGERPNLPAVWKIPLPARGPAKPFFGDPDKAGSDASHLDEPRGIAIDGKGHLLIADRGNNRVVIVGEADGRLAASFAVPSPSWVGVHGKTGEVYVHSADSIVKYPAAVVGAPGDADRPKEIARLKLPQLPERIRARTGWYFALDSTAEPAVLWVGRNRGEDVLMRCEDRGRAFGPLKRADYRPSGTYWNIAPGQLRREVACKVGGTVRILDEASGKTRDLRLHGSGGQTYRLGPNGQIYGMDHSYKIGIRRWDRDGKPLPFPATVGDAARGGRLPSVPSGTTSWERDFCVDRAGNVYVKQRGKRYHGRMQIDEFSPGGKFKRTVVWVVSDGAIGPRVDPQGNLYVADCIKPVGKPYPDYFKGRLPDVKIDKRGSVTQQYTWMYGSVIKFSPKGGAVWLPVMSDDDIYGFDGEAKLPAGLAKERVDSVHRGKLAAKPAHLQGALWWRLGCSYLLDMHPGHNRRCHCTATEFDVDDFGRVFYTDQGRFRVVVLDTNGNRVAAFGGYGNQDYCGPDGYVVDPQGGFLRPARPSDPPDLKRPFASPKIAFNWFVGLGVTDRFAYVADGYNRRVVRVRLGYTAEQTVSVK